MFFLLFLLNDRKIRIRNRISDSWIRIREAQNMWVRIRYAGVFTQKLTPRNLPESAASRKANSDGSQKLYPACS